MAAAAVETASNGFGYVEGMGSGHLVSVPSVSVHASRFSVGEKRRETIGLEESGFWLNSFQYLRLNKVEEERTGKAAFAFQLPR